MKIHKLLITFSAIVIIVTLLIINGYSARNVRSLATDFPRGALVFAQFSDLPTMLKSWNNSELKERYLSSANYQQFTDRHLGTKIADRFTELSNALGIEVNDKFLDEISEKQAAIAIYDIGRLDVVFIAPLTTEKFLLSSLLANKSGFEENKLKSGAKYFVKEIEVDRERQTQRISFALENGYFILTTNEQLMIRTLANVSSKAQSTDRLTSEPTYQNLIKKVTPHYATIWVAQEKLNKDYYFRNYWIMKNLDELKNIKAAIFDIELKDKEWREERYFLTKTDITAKQIPSLEVKRISQFIPDDLPYLKIEAVDQENKISKTIHNYLFDNDLEPSKATKRHSYYYYVEAEQSEPSDYYYDDYVDYYLYEYDFNKQINDPVDADDLETTPTTSYYNRKDVLEKLDQIFSSAKTIALLQEPQAIDGPLFAEFHKAIIVSLEDVTNFDQLAFETAISKLASDSTMIAGNSNNLSWQNLNNQTRVLIMPMLGWEICYQLRGQDLIISNDRNLLRKMEKNASSKRKLEKIASKPITNLTVIDFTQRQQVFDNIFNKIQEDAVDDYQETHATSGASTEDFFTGNIASLLDSVSPVEKIIITKDSSSGQFHELIRIKLIQDKSN
ncbi:MAG: hypothetical protein WAQ98_10955 [Blastocatellia bacterium]